jgi:translation initiation factor 4E
MKGGKWIVRLKKGLASRYWEESMMALVGGQFTGVPDGEICGVVLSVRYSEDILGVWNKTATDRESTERIRESLKKILQLPPHAHMEYKPHQTSLQDKSSFRNTQVWKRSDSRGGEERGTTRRSSSWGERDSAPSTSKPKRDTERSWR